MSERTERLARLQTVEVVLRLAWDPIGVRGIADATDEYEGYARAIVGMLERAASDREIADYLTSVEVELMGLTARTAKNADIASMLRELHAINQTASDGS